MIFNHIFNTSKYIKGCDFSKVVKSKTEARNNTVSWTATRDCWVQFKAFSWVNVGYATVSVNGVEIMRGSYNESISTYSVPFYIKRGSIIKIYSSHDGAAAGFIAYGCLP